MLVSFETKDYPPITMFGDIARQLLKIMGMSGNVPGAVKGRDVGTALTRLQSGLAAVRPVTGDSEPPAGDDEGAPAVSLANRAFPLLELMSLASDNGYAVTWKVKS